MSILRYAGYGVSASLLQSQLPVAAESEWGPVSLIDIDLGGGASQADEEDCDALLESLGYGRVQKNPNVELGCSKYDVDVAIDNSLADGGQLNLLMTTANKTVTLPASAYDGSVVVVKAGGVANITVAGTIDGGGNFVLANPGESVTLMKTSVPGYGWAVIAHYTP